MNTETELLLAEFAKYLDAGASTVVGNPADLAHAFRLEYQGRKQQVLGNAVGTSS